MSDLASALIAARRGSAALRVPDLVPGDLQAAMHVQRDVCLDLGETVAGWKVGFSPDGVPVAGPLYANVVQASPARMQLPMRGFIVEIELAFRLARDLPRGSYAREDILDAVDEALIGIELIAGRLGEPPATPYFAFLADNIGNAGYVTGAATREFARLDLKALPLRFAIDGRVTEEKRGGHPQGDPVEPLRAYASQQIDALGGLRKGQIVTTGSLSKPLRVEAPGRLEATLDGVGSVALDLTR